MSKRGLDEAPVTNTTAGPIVGAATDHGFVFCGVPYAAAPVGHLRFRPPEPPQRWEFPRDCTAFGADCPQVRPGRLGGLMSEFFSAQRRDEDCLALNVWTPALTDDRRPTMVWFHGGGFMGGSAAAPMYDGTRFAREGVVLVTVNYRLHALGSLYLDGLFEGASGTGNLAVLDLVAALEWVRDNISAFGGDPDNVTIFGESAGAGYVGTLLGTPRADGLYRRAVLQSGAASHELTPGTAERVTRRMLELLGVAPGDWDALRSVPAARIARASWRVWLESPRVLGHERALKIPFLPVTDGVVRRQRAIDRVVAGETSTKAVLVGTCADEYRAFVWGMPPVVRRVIPKPNVSALIASSAVTADELIDVYTTLEPTATERDVLAAIEGDQMFTIPAIRLADAHSAAGGATWMYRFTWPTPAAGGALRACHGLDVPFVFDNLHLAGKLWGPQPPQHLANAMHAAWVQFAATGDPNVDGCGRWPTYDEIDRSVLAFGAERAVEQDPHREERRVWAGVW